MLPHIWKVTFLRLRIFSKLQLFFKVLRDYGYMLCLIWSFTKKVLKFYIGFKKESLLFKANRINIYFIRVEQQINRDICYRNATKKKHKNTHKKQHVGEFKTQQQPACRSDVLRYATRKIKSLKKNSMKQFEPFVSNNSLSAARNKREGVLATRGRCGAVFGFNFWQSFFFLLAAWLDFFLAARLVAVQLFLFECRLAVFCFC